MVYPEEVIEELRVRNDIVDVISEYIKLVKKGQYFFGLCPFHGEKTSSFSVTPSKQIYYCYGCGKAGDVFNFIMDTEGLTFIDAVKFLAQRINYQLPEGDNEADRKRASLKKKIIGINTLAAKYFHNNLFEEKNKIARDYLNSRELSINIIRKFGLGYSNGSWDDLLKYLIRCGKIKEDIIKSDLVISNKKGGFFDRFRNRIMFPIFDVTGNVIGFGGRSLDDSLPKYMNSPETILYNKRQSLFNLNLAKKISREKIIVVEGYMDVISLYQRGIKNVVASLGTALTEGQARILKNYSDEILISYDTDTAGKMATLRGLDMLNKVGANVKVLKIPDGKDPDEFIKKYHKDQFDLLIENSISFIDYKLELAKNNEDDGSMEGKIKFLNSVAEVLSEINNKVELEMYINKISVEYKISEESIKAEINKKYKPSNNLKPIKKNILKKNNVIKKRNKVKYEEILLCLLSLDNSLYDYLKNKISIEYFDNNNIKIAKFLFDRLEKNKSVVPADLISNVEDGSKTIFAKIFQKDVCFPNNIKAAESLIYKIELENENKRRNEILALLRESEKNNLSERDVEKLKRELKMITMRKK
ncbi:MAG: DNA primase [Clostridiales bacterium]